MLAAQGQKSKLIAVVHPRKVMYSEHAVVSVGRRGESGADDQKELAGVYGE